MAKKSKDQKKGGRSKQTEKSTQDSKRKKSAKGKKVKKQPRTARNSDRHELYQLSVQNVEHEEEFLTETFERIRGRRPMTLREDFCGTALACAQWVTDDPHRTAIGLDLDEEVLAWGQERNIDPLGQAASQVKLMKKNVLTVTKKKVEVLCAMNFSYFIFKKRKELLKYFDVVKRSLVSDGIFVMDCYGGSDAQVVMEEKRAVDGFTYIWDQAAYNPITNEVLNHIHFGFRKGGRMSKAFTYDWRLWTPMEIRECLEEVGFRKVEVCWEQEDADGEETGEYLPQTEAETQPGWLAYIVAIL